MSIDEPSNGVLVVRVIVHIGDRELFLSERGDMCLHLQLIQGIKVNILRRPQIQQILLQLIVVPFIPLQLGVSISNILLLFLQQEGHAAHELIRSDVGLNPHILQFNLCGADHQEHAQPVDVLQAY